MELRLISQESESDSDKESENFEYEVDDGYEEFFSCDDTDEETEKSSLQLLDKISLLDDDCRTLDGETKNYSASIRSYSTTSTIAPEVIKARVKKALLNREKKELRKRIVAKGEASATTRSRRENRDVIKESDGIWG